MHEFYKNKKVLVTGCRGFKGSWLALWLDKIGANVYGYGHFPDTYPNHNDLLGAKYPMREELLDHRSLGEFITEVQPDIVFHLAAHAIVTKCFKDPRETFENNVMACVNILDVCRLANIPIVFITTDKVYEDLNWIWGYRENDTLGGKDPYSASKVCMEHITRCYRESYGTKVVVARAGNVIGGGDWSEGRLIPDIMKATAKSEKVTIRTPHATRPWQHVLSALDGYLRLGKALLQDGLTDNSFNFGPLDELNVQDILTLSKSVWSDVDWIVDPKEIHPHMVYLLKIDSSRARQVLGWKPPWDVRQSVRVTVDWYKNYYANGEVNSIKDIERYERDYNALQNL